MKKLLISTLAAFVLVTTGTAFAQVDSADHQLFVSIPDLVIIRILTTDGLAAVVDFDYADPANEAAYVAAIESATGGWLPATGGNVSDVEVLVSNATLIWDVDVTAGAFALAGLALADVRVTPTAAAAFTLDAGADIATGGGGGGWTSLGITAASYDLFVDGDEDAGTDTITVTYTLTAI